MSEDIFLRPMGASVPISDATRHPENQATEKINRAVLALESTPSEEFQTQYQSRREGESPEKNKAQRKKIAATIALALRNKKSPVTGGWNKERLEAFENESARKISDQREIDFPDFVSTAETWNEQDVALMPSEDLVRAFAGKRFFSHEMPDYIGILNRINSPEGNALLHRVLDFIQSYLKTLQNDPTSELEEGQDSFMHLLSFIETEGEKSKNYLIKKHLLDIAETWKVGAIEKKGMLHGVTGGSSDETIFTFARLHEAYENRLKYGIRGGNLISNPLIEIAPEHIAQYSKNGRIEKIFSAKDLAHNPDKRSAEAIAQNNPQDDFIYTELNKPHDLTGRMSHPSNKLRKLQALWDFSDYLTKEGRHFFFDLSKIDARELHPLVLGELIHRNSEYLKNQLGEADETAPLDEKRYLKKLFPTGNVSPEQLCSYKYLTSLSIRKKIEDDFGLDIATLDFAYQRTFLSFLESRDIENVELLKTFVHKFGITGMKCFLSLDHGGQSMGKKILIIGEKLPPESAEAIFSKYAELADAAKNIRTNLADFFTSRREVSEENTNQVADALLTRGKDLLTSFADQIEDEEVLNHEQLLKELESIKQDTLFLNSLIKALVKSGETISFEDFRQLDFPTTLPEGLSEADRSRMFAITERTYAGKPIAKKVAQEGLRHGLSNPETRFYVLRRNGEIIAFDRFEESENEIYFGSVNLDPDHHGSAIGDAMLRRSLDQEAEKEKTIVAHGDPTTSICSDYIEKYGFVVDKIELDYHGMPLFQISRKDATNKQYIFRNPATKMSLATEFENLESGKDSSIFELPFDHSQAGLDSERLRALQQKMESESLVITRFFPDKKSKPNKLLAVLEKKIKPAQK